MATQIVQVEQFLPLLSTKSDLTVSTADYILNLQRRNCVDSKIVEDATLQRIRDSFASEHGARYDRYAQSD
jgi:hypothetical protein